MGKCFQRIGNYSFFVWSVLFFAMCLCVGFKGVVNATQYYSETESKETEDDKVEMEENVEQMENDYYKDFYDNVEMDEISRDLQEITGSYGRKNDISFDVFYELLFRI